MTESEKEFREAICLCGTHMCRGSYLYFTGSRAFMQVMASRHNMLHRQAIIARAGIEPVTDEDRARIKRHGLGDSCLGSMARGDRVPEWLEKWTALVSVWVWVGGGCLSGFILFYCFTYPRGWFTYEVEAVFGGCMGWLEPQPSLMRCFRALWVGMGGRGAEQCHYDTGKGKGQRCD